MIDLVVPPEFDLSDNGPNTRWLIVCEDRHQQLRAVMHFKDTLLTDENVAHTVSWAGSTVQWANIKCFFRPLPLDLSSIITMAFTGAYYLSEPDKRDSAMIVSRLGRYPTPAMRTDGAVLPKGHPRVLEIVNSFAELVKGS